MRDKVSSLPPTAPPRRLGRATVVGLGIYYLLCVAALVGLGALRRAAVAASAAPPGAATASPTEPPLGTPVHLADAMRIAMRELPGWLDAAIQMSSAFLLVLPIAFVYVRSRTRAKYDQSLAQTVVVLPTVVAAILIVVQNSLALAFSLAGIVAAVRFRNNLKDSRDAVYIFAAVGIGFATGVHDTGVAVILSLGFTALELLIWRVDLGAEHDSMFGRPWFLSLSERFNGTGHAAPAAVVSSRAVPPAANRHTLALRERENTLPPGATIAMPPGDFRLRVYAENLDAAQPAVETVLDRDVKRWELTRTTPGYAGGGVLEYRVRERKRHRIDEVRDRLLARAAPDVVRIEVLPVDRVSDPPSQPS